MEYNELLSSLDPKDFDISEAAERLTQHYEAAGFSDYYNRVISKMNEWQILEAFCETFCIDDEARGVDSGSAEAVLEEIRKRK